MRYRMMMVALLVVVVSVFALPAALSASCRCDSTCLSQSCDPGDGEEPCTNMSCHMSMEMCFESFCFEVDDAAKEIRPCVEAPETTDLIFSASPACSAGARRQLSAAAADTVPKGDG
jgi:hypothetical protein